MNTGFFMRKHAKSIIFIVIVLSLAGIFSSLHLPVSLFPNIAFPRIVILADAGDIPADRMMITTTRKLEEAVNSIPDVIDVRSTTSRGSSELSVNFHWNIDMVKAQLLVNNALNQIKNDLPTGVHITVRRMNPTVYPIIGYSLTSNRQSLEQLRTYAQFTLRPLLTRIDGVANVAVLGGRTREYQVIVNPERLRSYQLSLKDLVQAIQQTNIIKSVGRLQQDYKLYLTLVDGQYAGKADIGHTLVKLHNQEPVFLDDVAAIRESVKPVWTRVTSNGKLAVLLNVYQQPGGNTVQIDTQIKQTLASLGKKIPRGISISKFYDQSDLIVESMKNVRDSIVIGIILAVFILFVFLRNWKITLIASLDIPITIAITTLMLQLLHMSFNIMTLGGIAAAIALIIDDAIVVVENIIRHLALHKASAEQSVLNSLQELLHPILGSSFSTIVVFAPLAFLTGVTGAFFKSLSLTMACSLLVSMLLAIFFIPILGQRFISEQDAEKQEKPSRVFQWLHTKYDLLLRALFKRKYLAVIVGLVLVASSYFLYKGLPSGFLPYMDEGTFILDYHTPSGTSLEETNRVDKQIGDILTNIPEVVSYSRRTGLQLGGGITEANMGDFLVRLTKHRKRGIQAIMNDVRQRIHTSVPGIQVEFSQLMVDLIGDLTSVPQPIEIKVFGDDYQQIHGIAKQVVQNISHVRGVVDIYNGVTIAGSDIRIKVDSLRAGEYGFTTEDVRQEVIAAIQGEVASEIQGKQIMRGIRVWYPPQERANLDKIKRLRIRSPRGEYVSLAALANFAIKEGQPELTRENLQQMIAVTARLNGRDMGSALREIQGKLKQNLSLPQNVSIRYGGLYKEQQKSFQGLLIVMIMAFLLVFTVQLIEFEMFKIPMVILLTDVLSLFGVFLLLRLTGIGLNITSMMGMIMIVGIVAENAIFFIHYIQLLHTDKRSLAEAIIEAGKIRMRPIIMTTLAAVLALMPLAVAIGAGAQMQQPLAIAVIGGFSVSALILLLLLPVFYLMFFGKQDT